MSCLELASYYMQLRVSRKAALKRVKQRLTGASKQRVPKRRPYTRGLASNMTIPTEAI